MIEKMKKERTRLEGELKKGRQMLIKIQQKANNLTANMHRIQGAIQFIDSQTKAAEEVPCENVDNPAPETENEPE